MAATQRVTPVPADIEQRQFDAIVIGAGINGAGIARDAALRGLTVLLLDKGDIGSGTTSWSTRLIHGGLRYLEYYEVPLVRESLREREVLLKIAPHLVHPLGFLIPIYEGGKRGPGLIRLGMIAYDILSYDKSMARHHMLSRDETLRLEPGLNPAGLRGAAFYYDAQVTFPERLSVENALSARDHGAVVLTYCRVDEPLTDGQGTVTGVRFTDLLSGGQYSVHSAVTVNVAGPWVDEVLGDRDGHRYIGGTKGSHIVVDPFPGAPKEALYVEAAADGRPYFIVPWNQHYLIGTTDIRYTGDLDEVVPDEEEIEYLLQETDRVLPGAGLRREDVLFAYAGVRPLPYQESGSTSSITRSHIIHPHQAPLTRMISIIGGKITTYRGLAEETVDLIFKLLDRPSPPVLSGRVPLPGGNVDDYPAFASDFVRSSGLDERSSRHLLNVYGVMSRQVMRIAEQDPELRQVMSPDTGAIGAEVPFAARWELAETLEDVLMRRTMVGLDASNGLDALKNAAAVAQQTLGWSARRAGDETEAYTKHVRRFRPRALLYQAPAGERPQVPSNPD